MLDINPNLRLLFHAKPFIGQVHEVTPNHGPLVDQFLSSVGLAPGNAWCMAFLQYLIRQVEQEFGCVSQIYRSGGVIETWQKTHQDVQCPPKPGSLILFKTSEGHGHCGLIRDVIDTLHVSTIEGNTNNAGSRDGDGVYEHVRLSHLGPRGFETLGVLQPFRYPI